MFVSKGQEDMSLVAPDEALRKLKTTMASEIIRGRVNVARLLM
jgi:hypothetical protein